MGLGVEFESIINLLYLRRTQIKMVFITASKGLITYIECALYLHSHARTNAVERHSHTYSCVHVHTRKMLTHMLHMHKLTI